MEEELTFEEVETLIHDFMVMSKKFHNHMSSLTQGFELTIQQYQLLHIISKEEDLNQKKVAKMLNITPATLSVRIKRLEDQNLIVRQTKIEDKRNFSLQITDKGYELMTVCEAYRNKMVMKLFSGVKKSQIESAREMFMTMSKNIENHDK